MKIWGEAISMTDNGIEIKNVKVVKGRVEKLEEEVSELKSIVSELSYTVDELVNKNEVLKDFVKL